MKLSKHDKLNRLAKLSEFIISWVDRESNEKTKEEALAIRKLARSDLDYVGWLIRHETTNSGVTGQRLTKDDMTRCNQLHKKYSAISDVRFSIK